MVVKEGGLFQQFWLSAGSNIPVSRFPILHPFLLQNFSESLHYEKEKHVGHVVTLLSTYSIWYNCLFFAMLEFDAHACT